MARKKESQTPTPLGEILLEEFLKPMKIARAWLAMETGIPRKVISEIISGKRGLDKSQAEALSKFFKTGPEFWINLHNLDVPDRANAVGKKGIISIMGKVEIDPAYDYKKMRLERVAGSLHFNGKAKTLEEMSRRVYGKRYLPTGGLIMTGLEPMLIKLLPTSKIIDILLTRQLNRTIIC